MLEDAFSIYLKYERNYSPLTVDRYADDLRLFHSFFKSQHPEMEWQTVTSETVRQWMMSMMEKGGKATSVNRRLSSLRTFFKFLLRKEYITEDPTLKIVGPKKEKYLPSFVKESDMNRLLDSTEFGSGFKASRDRLILLMFYLTGMRRAELIGLDVRDVDLSASQIKVTGKRNKQRLIPFATELKDAICKYLQDRDSMFPEAPEAFFLDDKGKRITESASYKNEDSRGCLQKKIWADGRKEFPTSPRAQECPQGVPTGIPAGDPRCYKWPRALNLMHEY